MAPGRFRTIGNLGRGQFSVADKVVGNFGEYAGLAARKLPTTTVSPQAEYGATAELTNYLNQRFKPSILQRAYSRMRGQTASQPIAPYVAVNDKGGFQQLADGYVPWQRWGLKRRLSDLHAQNKGPNGQILDYSVERGTNTMNRVASPTPASQAFSRERIDSAPVFQPEEFVFKDLYGNIGQHGPDVAGQLRPLVQQSNNNIRKYWSMPEAQRPSYLKELQNRQVSGTQQAIEGFQHGKAIEFGNAPTGGYVPAGNTRTADYGPRKIGVWTDFKYDPRPYLAVGGVAGAGAGGLGYGGYQAYQHFFGQPGN